jgi:hypothetical protein
MMMTGVLAAVLAAVTALPFTPPAGWVQLPQSMTNARVTNVWHGPKVARGSAQSFSAAVFPFPGTAQMLASGGAKAANSTSLIKTISNTGVTLCGTPARMVTSRVSAGSASAILEQEIAVKSGYAYMLVYTRPNGTAESAQIRSVMRAFCPSGTGSMPAMQLPAGWTKSNTELQVAGVWMGTQAGQVLTLMRGTQMGSLDELMSAARLQSISEKQGNMSLKITAQNPVTMCGYPGRLVDMQVNTPMMPMQMHLALTQGNGSSYVLMYMQMGTAPTDAAAITALHSLCATGASPSPSASPSPEPSASPR